jgi:hypothetical protein
MFNYQVLGRLPEAISFTRMNSRCTARLVQLGEVRIARRRLWIADTALVDQVRPLPVWAPNGAYPIHSYEWTYEGQAVNACVIIAFRLQKWTTTRQLKVRTRIRPDLCDGIIVDSGEIAVRSLESVTVPAGLGDGYYPVVANYNLGLFLQSLVVDFKPWEVRQIIKAY